MPLPSTTHRPDDAVAVIATALVTACQLGDTAQVQALASQYPAAVTTELQSDDNGSNDGWTPLHHALAVGASLDMVHALVLANPVVLTVRTTKEARTALHFAAGCPTTKGPVVDFLIHQRPSLATELDGQGRSALHWVCVGQKSTAAVSTNPAAEPPPPRPTTTTPPTSATVRSHADLGIVRKLYEAWKAAIGLPDCQGLLPIHAAYLSGAPGSYLKYLGSLNPDSVSIPLSNGRLLAHCVASDLAQGKVGSRPEVLESLIQADSATMYIPDPVTGKTLIESAQEDGQGASRVVRNIIKNYDGRTTVGLGSQTPSSLRDSKTDSKTKTGKSMDVKTKENECKSSSSSSRLKYSDEQVADMIVRACAQESASAEEIALLIRAYPRAVRVRDQENFLPLHWACYHGATVQLLQLLVNAWPESIRETIGQDRLPLHLACRQSATLDCIQFLVSRYPESPEKVTAQGMLPIHYACRDVAPLDVVQFLVDQAPMTLSEGNANGSLPIHFACKHGKSPETIDFLVGRWPSCLHAPRKDGVLPIHFLCRGSASLALLSVIVSKDVGALEIEDAEGNIALHHLCRNPRASVQAVRVLVDAYPEGINALNTKKQTPADLAAEVNQEVASFLVTTVAKRRKTGGTRPLHQICSDPRASVQMVKNVLSESPDEVCVPDDERCLPLHIACRTGASLDVIRHLVEGWPESLRWTSKGGSLPLHTACSNMADVSVVQYLISVFPKAIEIANDYGWLPLHCACAYGASSDVISLLVASNDKSSRMATYGQGDYPLHLACCGSASLEVIYWLTEAREEGIKLTNNAGELALHKACFNNAPIEVVQFLVEQYPHSVFVADEYGSTPLQIAELRKNYALAEWLKSKEV